ncbi:MAG: hypothetical protein ABI554_11445 [Flavobacterium sp.]
MKIVFEIIQNRIALPFVEDETENGTVCFAANDEVRADYKRYFTSYDVVNYVYGIISETYCKQNKRVESMSLLEIRYPINASFFWNYSILGAKIRLQKPIPELELMDSSKLNWQD